MNEIISVEYFLSLNRAFTQTRYLNVDVGSFYNLGNGLEQINLIGYASSIQITVKFLTEAIGGYVAEKDKMNQFLSMFVPDVYPYALQPGFFTDRSNSNTFMISPGELHPGGWLYLSNLKEETWKLAEDIWHRKEETRMVGVLADMLEDEGHVCEWICHRLRGDWPKPDWNKSREFFPRHQMPTRRSWALRVVLEAGNLKFENGLDI